ncbi:MAG TPA: hypothetical protein VF043_04990 [Ktedonobacteraceae bacterium]
MQNSIPQPSRKIAWNETVRAWQSAVDGTLDIQARWLRDWNGRVQVTSGRRAFSHPLSKSGIPLGQACFLFFTHHLTQFFTCSN